MGMTLNVPVTRSSVMYDTGIVGGHLPLSLNCVSQQGTQADSCFHRSYILLCQLREILSDELWVGFKMIFL